MTGPFEKRSAPSFVEQLVAEEVVRSGKTVEEAAGSGADTLCTAAAAVEVGSSAAGPAPEMLYIAVAAEPQQIRWAEVQSHLAAVAVGLAGRMRTARTGGDQDGRCSPPNRHLNSNTLYVNEKKRKRKLLQRKA